MSVLTPWRPPGTSLYIHVPYCASKCSYCDFDSVGGVLEHEEAVQFVDGIIDEVGRFGAVLEDIPTAYVGGGTPTLLESELTRLVREVVSLPGISEGYELTVEANPDSLSRRFADELAEAGATRVSLGVQSFDDSVLALLGRRHDAGTAASAADALRSSGLRFSIDLMCGIPGQSNTSWETSLATAVAAGAGHLSVYPLAIEESTPLGVAIEAGEFPDTDPDVAAEQMTRAAAFLRGQGFHRYEVASYARDDEWCRHNARYWTGGSYVGVGRSAASMLTVRQARETPVRSHVEDSLPDDARLRFISSDLPHGIEVLTSEQATREDAMLGMRLREGIGRELAECAQLVPVLSELEQAGLVTSSADRWSTTERGWLLGNAVFGRLWAGE